MKEAIRRRSKPPINAHGLGFEEPQGQRPTNCRPQSLARATREKIFVMGVKAVFVRTWYKNDRKKSLSREALARVRILTRL